MPATSVFLWSKINVDKSTIMWYNPIWLTNQQKEKRKMAIKILVDSASDITEKEAREMGIEMIPMTVSFGSEEFFDGVTITHEEFYKRLKESKSLPHTSQISPVRFEEKFKEMTKNGDSVIAILLSSKLSGTYQNAVMASKSFKNVYVIDSLSATVGERLLCIYAQGLIAQGLEIGEIVKELHMAKCRLNIMALLDTLEYLKKGGRISAVTAFVGTALSVKPVVSVIDGEVKQLAKALGSKMGQSRLSTLAKEKGIDFTMPYAVIYSSEGEELLDSYIKNNEQLWKGHTEFIPRHMVGGTIGTHIGPGAIGVCFFSK